MGRPRLMLLIRHAQSEGNQNRAVHQIIPDHRVKLTSEGWQQAKDAGKKLRSMLEPTDTVQIFTSPYRRTVETTEGILSSLTASDESTGSPSPFQRDDIRVYEEPRIREQDFGNFQPCSVEMERMWRERADYGHFFYRIPNGESAADAYDRVAGFNETLFRNFSEPDFPSVCVLVTHGLLARVFLMKWYHWSTAYFEDLKNINHCEILVMRRNDSDGHLPVEQGKYILENKLRTWSEMKKGSGGGTLTSTSGPGLGPGPGTKTATGPPQLDLSNLSLGAAAIGPTTIDSTHNNPAAVLKSPSIPPRLWGGCIGGCNHKPYPTAPSRRAVIRDTSASVPSSPVALRSSSLAFVAEGDRDSGTKTRASEARTEKQPGPPNIHASFLRRPVRDDPGIHDRKHNYDHHDDDDVDDDVEIHSDGERAYSSSSSDVIESRGDDTHGTTTADDDKHSHNTAGPRHLTINTSSAKFKAQGAAGVAIDLIDDAARAPAGGSGDNAKVAGTGISHQRPSRRHQPTETDLQDWVRRSGMGSGARADALGDEPDESDDPDDPDDPDGSDEVHEPDDQPRNEGGEEADDHSPRTGSVAEEVL